MSGIMGSTYQIGNAYSWALAGFVVGLFGWRWSFWIPAGIVIVSAIHWFIRGRNAPEEVGLPTIEEEAKGTMGTTGVRKDHHVGFTHTLRLVLLTPRIWAAALGLFCLNIVRYGFMSWAPTYMFEVQKATISTAAYKAIAIPIAGSLGAFFAGWVSDRFFGSRRAPVATIMLLMLGLFAWLYPKIPAGQWILSLLCLLLIGFMTYGPHVLIVGTLPMDCGTRKAAASTAGFIDCFGYIGAALTGVGSGWLVDNYGWNATFYFWVAGAVVAAIVMLTLWNYRPTKGKYY
jgi:OPA family glycerol-3-phosphate transporter-like MFS transporter